MSTSAQLVGERFSHLLVVKRMGHDYLGRSQWECLCDCGNTTIGLTGQLKSGKKRSCGCTRRLEKGEGSFNGLFGIYKRAARYRHIDFLLTSGEFRKLTKGNCFYCGMPPKSVMRFSGCNGEYIYNGIDRRDNSIGYLKSNCVSCCTYCNRAKNDRSESEFLDWVKQVYQHTEENRK